MYALVNLCGPTQVVQCDCPEDTDQYIHRVGRTARYISAFNLCHIPLSIPTPPPLHLSNLFPYLPHPNSYHATGKSLLFLAPSELRFVEKLQAAKVAVKKIRIDPSRTLSLRTALQTALVEDADLKFVAQKVKNFPQHSSSQQVKEF